MYCGLMKRVAARPPSVPTMVTTAINHLKRATALNPRRQSTPVAGCEKPWPNPMSAPVGRGAAGATAGTVDPACKGSGLVVIGKRTSTCVGGAALGGAASRLPCGKSDTARHGAYTARVPQISAPHPVAGCTLVRIERRLRPGDRPILPSL